MTLCVGAHFTTQGVGMQCIIAVTNCGHVHEHLSIPTMGSICNILGVTRIVYSTVTVVQFS